MTALGYSLSIIYAAVCILVGTALYKLGIDKAYTRKLVHILIGAEWFILYYTVGAGLHLFLICILFTFALFLEYRIKILPAMSSSGDNAPGTVYYGVAMSALSLLTFLFPAFIYPFGVAVLCTSLGDGIGGLVGFSVKSHNPRLFGSKTLFGTLAVFAISLISVIIFSYAYEYKLSILGSLFIALLTASVELVSRRGVDNLTVPLSTSAAVYIFTAFPSVEQYFFALSVLPLIIAVIYEKKALTPTATLAASILALVCSAAFKNIGVLLLLIYFASAIITDKIEKKREKSEQNSQNMKFCPSQRNVHQVIENGFMPFLFAILNIIYPSEIFAAGFIVSLGESLADTAASGIGSRSCKVYNIIGLKKVTPGVSGGVSLLGTLAGLCFSILLPLIAFAFNIISPIAALICALVSFFGMLFDSVLGSLLQPKYKCTRCASISDSPFCCNVQSPISSGNKFFTNGRVNLFSSVIASVLLCAVLLLVK